MFLAAERARSPVATVAAHHMARLRAGIRCIVTLECTEARPAGATPSRYVTQKVCKLMERRTEQELHCCVEPCFLSLCSIR